MNNHSYKHDMKNRSYICRSDGRRSSGGDNRRNRARDSRESSFVSDRPPTSRVFDSRRRAPRRTPPGFPTLGISERDSPTPVSCVRKTDRGGIGGRIFEPSQHGSPASLFRIENRVIIIETRSPPVRHATYKLYIAISNSQDPTGQIHQLVFIFEAHLHPRGGGPNYFLVNLKIQVYANDTPQ